MTPRSEAELAEIIREAKAPLRIEGGGTRAIGTADGEVLKTGGLSGIRHYEPGALTLVAGAGTPLAEVEATLAAEGQRLAFEPPDLRAVLGRKGVSTIGGVVAANASGPRRVQAGACRDALLGVRFVDGTGTVVKNGGRVMKNVTGYDLVKLMAGSHGTLGVLSEVSLKVPPAPEAAATLVVEIAEPARAVAALSAAMASPYDVTGAAHDGAQAMVRIEGFAASVAYRAERLFATLAAFGPVAVERHDGGPGRWAAIRDATALAGTGGAIWRLSVKPSDAPETLARIGAQAVLLDWAGGLIWARVPDGSDLRARLRGLGGHATRLCDRGGGPAFAPEPAPVAALSTGIRARFDPKGILNPGLMG
ncbi:MAG: FAD-binding protein [Paracoccaceae bacterium]